MNIYSYEEAFGAADKTSSAMKSAISDWFSLYYDDRETQDTDPGQRIAYCVVNKLMKTVFGEYQVSAQTPFEQQVAAALDKKRLEAMQLALIGGECYLKPWVTPEKIGFGVIPRNNFLVFARDSDGNITDMGIVERTVDGKHYYTLLERRYVDKTGCLVIENRLFQSLNSQSLGNGVPLSQVAKYAHLPAKYRYSTPMGLGLVQLKTPAVNCVDGSADGVSIYAAAAGLIRSIDENEAQLKGEFRRGESRVIASADMLDRDQQLTEHLFVGLDADPEEVGITVFAPQLREESYLRRKEAYLRSVESLIGLKRGTLSEVTEQQKTATEITSSAGDYNLTVIALQRMWQEALMQAVELCRGLAQSQGHGVKAGSLPTVDWGNGILYDEDKAWADYLTMVEKGLLKPELALAWRFNLPAQTETDLQSIRANYMP